MEYQHWIILATQEIISDGKQRAVRQKQVKKGQLLDEINNLKRNLESMKKAPQNEHQLQSSEVQKLEDKILELESKRNEIKALEKMKYERKMLQ